MGEARLRKAREAQKAGLRAAQRKAFAELERLMGEDPDDRAIREAHGFAYDDDWRDEAVLCRNGCGLSYSGIVAGKVRECHPATARPQ